jgi:hypothetical protein
MRHFLRRFREAVHGESAKSERAKVQKSEQQRSVRKVIRSEAAA